MPQEIHADICVSVLSRDIGGCTCSRMLLDLFTSKKREMEKTQKKYPMLKYPKAEIERCNQNIPQLKKQCKLYKL